VALPGAPMMLLGTIDRYWFAPMPAERLATLRVITGAFATLYLLLRSPHLTGYAHFPARQFAPIGVVTLLDAPLPAGLAYAVFAVTLLCGVAFVSGARYRLSGPLFALGFLWVTTYRSSWGMVFHQDNLVALHLLVLALAPAAEVWSHDARRLASRRQPPLEPAGRFGWAVRAMCWLTVVSYVLAGIAKLENAGWAWSEGEVLRTHVAYDAVRKLELGGIHSPIGAWLVRYEWPFSVLGLATLLLELGAPLALLHRRLAWVWVIGVWGFHIGVIALMAITFAYPVSGCAFASFFPVERLRELRLVRRVWPLPAPQ